MKAFSGLLTLCFVEEDLASGLVQLESEFTDSGLEGPELGEPPASVIIMCSPSTELESSLSNMFAQSWKEEGEAVPWLKRMAADGADGV